MAKVLEELGASTKTVIEVLNKADVVPPGDFVQLPVSREALAVSSLQHIGLEELLKAIDAALMVDPVIVVSFRLPQSEGFDLAALEGGSLVDAKRFEGNLVFLRARGPASLLNRYRSFHHRSSVI